MTPQVNLVSQQHQTVTHEVLIYKVSTSRDPLRLRSGTGTNYKILGKYKKGTEVIVLNKTTSAVRSHLPGRQARIYVQPVPDLCAD